MSVSLTLLLNINMNVLKKKKMKIYDLFSFKLFQLTISMKVNQSNIAFVSLLKITVQFRCIVISNLNVSLSNVYFQVVVSLFSCLSPMFIIFGILSLLFILVFMLITLLIFLKSLLLTFLKLLFSRSYLIDISNFFFNVLISVHLSTVVYDILFLF